MNTPLNLEYLVSVKKKGDRKKEQSGIEVVVAGA